MTAIPPPRVGADPGEAGQLLTYIAQTVDRIDGKVDSLADTMRREYVSRVELDPRLTRDELELTKLRRDLEAAEEARRQQREDDEQARQTREREQTRERRNLRLGIAGVGIAGASATTGVLALVLSHLPT